MARKRNDGTLLQDKLQEALKAYQENTPSFWYRFYDTKSAGRYLPAQPGDFLWLLPGVPAILIEAKSSETGQKLVSMISPAQRGKHKLWHRAGHLTAFVYCDLEREMVGWADGQGVVDQGVSHTFWIGPLDDLGSMLNSIARRLQGGLSERNP